MELRQIFRCCIFLKILKSINANDNVTGGDAQSFSDKFGNMNYSLYPHLKQLMYKVMLTLHPKIDLWHGFPTR